MDNIDTESAKVAELMSLRREASRQRNESDLQQKIKFFMEKSRPMDEVEYPTIELLDRLQYNEDNFIDYFKTVNSIHKPKTKNMEHHEEVNQEVHESGEVGSNDTSHSPEIILANEKLSPKVKSSYVNAVRALLGILEKSEEDISKLTIEERQELLLNGLSSIRHEMTNSSFTHYKYSVLSYINSARLQTGLEVLSKEDKVSLMEKYNLA